MQLRKNSILTGHALVRYDGNSQPYLLDVCSSRGQGHGRNTLNLALAVAYLRKLMDNAGVVRFLSQRYADILAEF